VYCQLKFVHDQKVKKNIFYESFCLMDVLLYALSNMARSRMFLNAKWASLPRVRNFGLSRFSLENQLQTKKYKFCFL
jgi:hypothetical protein